MKHQSEPVQDVVGLVIAFVFLIIGAIVLFT